ncbi:nucleotidyltransferase family protein [Fredinandcohnia sp. QZ13]|uniref:nucleotidyltransferase family protein n=1 Tax=Fredinandcohnia sp. QZ13 TaxID=3073144 RepID=UPI00285373FB|nr:nucleotidyltransferase family protein [Fredinandcohnia sp. QZ13]MDR4887522.1 nucleotidyltransferase family protein [Fredinandcohnia sp. QZ13]
MLCNVLKEKRNIILKIGYKHGIENIRVFGSVARLEDKPNSDLDLLVEINAERSLFDLIRFKHELEDLLGVSVDVVTENDIHWSIRQNVLAEAVQL